MIEVGTSVFRLLLKSPEVSLFFLLNMCLLPCKCGLPTATFPALTARGLTGCVDGTLQQPGLNADGKIYIKQGTEHFQR